MYIFVYYDYTVLDTGLTLFCCRATEREGVALKGKELKENPRPGKIFKV